MSNLQSASVVITGGATGIGLGVAKAMLKEGAKVLIGSRRADAVSTAVDSLKSLGEVYGHPVDVSDRSSVSSFFKYAKSSLPPITILIQAAGINIRDRTMQAMKPEDWDKVMGINATGAYNCMHAVLPDMISAKGGLIVNISSVAGKRAITLGGIAYCASKFAMTALGTAAGNELSEHGIRVTSIYPGEVNTPILDQRPVPVSDEHKARILQPEDVAAMVVAIAKLPPQAHVPELVIKPVTQQFC
jgi:NADP-dependent 3-hydroxy acid dehydrogenase YdfG